jgi:hypothetical protein
LNVPRRVVQLVVEEDASSFRPKVVSFFLQTVVNAAREIRVKLALAIACFHIQVAQGKLLNLGWHYGGHRVRVSLVHHHLMVLEVLLLWVMTVSILWCLMARSHYSPGISYIRSLNMRYRLSSRLILPRILRPINTIWTARHLMVLVVLGSSLLIHDRIVLLLMSPAT